MSHAAIIEGTSEGEAMRTVLVKHRLMLPNAYSCFSADERARYDAAAAELSKPYRDRIAELEAENARLRAVFVPPGSTLILIAPEIASQDEMLDAAERASKVHDGPVVILPHDWQSISRDEILSKLDAVGTSRPQFDTICTCPASSEYDPPCSRHGVLGVGVTGRD